MCFMALRWLVIILPALEQKARIFHQMHSDFMYAIFNGMTCDSEVHCSPETMYL